MTKGQILKAQDEWARDQPHQILKLYDHWKRYLKNHRQKEREREYDIAQNLSRDALNVYKKIRAAHFNMNITLSQEHKLIEKFLKQASQKAQKELYGNKLVHLSNTCVSPSEMTIDTWL